VTPNTAQAGWPVAGILLAVATLGVSSTSVAVVLPQVVADLGGTQSQYGWLIGTTLLAAAATGPAWGKLADRINGRTLFLVALLIFVGGTFIAGTSTSMEMLLAVRMLQGVGVGGVFVLANVIVSEIVAPAARSRYLSYVSATLSASTLGGPVLGGLIVGGGANWRWTFYAGLPAALMAFAVLLVKLDSSTFVPDPNRVRRRADIAGFVLIPLSIAVLLIAVSLLAGSVDHGLGWGLLALAAVGLAACVRVEQRAEDPVFRLAFFTDVEVGAALLGSLAMGFFGSIGIYLMQYLQIARASTPLQASLLTLPMVALITISSLIGGTLVGRRGRYKGTMLAGATALLAAILSLTLVNESTPLVFVVLGTAVMGVGFGLLQQNFIVAAQNAVDREHLVGITSSASFARSLGGAIASPMLALIYDSAVKGRMTAIENAAGPVDVDLSHVPRVAELTGRQLAAVQQAFGEAFGVLAWWCVPVAVVIAVVVLITRNRVFR